MTQDQSLEQYKELLQQLQTRFENNKHRHANLKWSEIEAKLLSNPQKLWSISEMEKTEGEPDVIEIDHQSFFGDCSTESPVGRRNLCYDQEAQKSRKIHPPKNNAQDLAKSMGIELMSEEEYRQLQTLGKFDNKTSSWIKTPPEIRQLGGALFADRRYNQVFIYHNGADSYYSARGFRGLLRI